MVFELLQSPPATDLFPPPQLIANVAQFILIPSQPLAQILLVEGTPLSAIGESESQNLVWEQFPFQGQTCQLYGNTLIGEWQLAE